MQGRLIGPYARQVTATRLKFWVAVRNGAGLRRYEVAVDTMSRMLSSRHRRFDYPTGSEYASNFVDYLIPVDLTGCPSTDLAGRDLKIALLDLLTDEDKADVVRVKIFGLLPEAA
jgi:hypothetical protein